MSQLKVDSVVPRGGIPAGAAAGGIIQCVTVTKTDTFTMSSTTFADITGLSATITPQSSSNKILVISNVYVCNTNGNNLAVKLLRGSTAISIGDASGSRTQATGFHVGPYDNDPDCITINYVDSPGTTSATTYKWQTAIRNGGTACINRGGGDADSNLSGRYASTLTLLEISG